MNFSLTMRQWFRFAAYGAMFWLVFCVGLPRLLSLSESWRTFGAAQDKWNIHAGAVYYTDVPVTRDTETANRAAVRQALDKRLQAISKADTGTGM